MDFCLKDYLIDYSILCNVPGAVFMKVVSQVLGFSLLCKNIAELGLRTGSDIYTVVRLLILY